MKKLFFILICGFLMGVGTMKVQAQSQSTISSVALTDKDPKVRIAAIEQSTSQSTISSVALNDKNSKVRIAALQLRE